MKHIWMLVPSLIAVNSWAASPSQIAIFGTVDLGLVKRTSGQSTLHGTPANDQWNLMQGARSRIGFRGSEDLGNGMRANFVLEHSFTPDDGKPLSPNTFWHAQSWVGLSGGFGEFRLGRDYAPGHQMATRADPFSFDTVGQVGIAQAWLGYTSSGGASRMNNAVIYKTPNLHGWTAQFAMSLSETPGVSNERGASLSYDKGAWYAGLGWDRKDSTLGRNDLWILTGNYRWQNWIWRASHTQVHLQGQKRKNWTLGANYRIGASEIIAVASQQKMAAQERTNKLGLGYHYWLSKRTKIYTDIARAKGSNQTGTNGFDLGIHHRY